MVTLLFNCYCRIIVGTSKRRFFNVNNGKGPPPKKPAHELDNGLVPLPAKICFMCSK